jgi:hypothetical protein
LFVSLQFSHAQTTVAEAARADAATSVILTPQPEEVFVGSRNFRVGAWMFALVICIPALFAISR